MNILLLDALLDPARVTRLDAADWDLLIRQGRRANLLGRLAQTLIDRDLLPAVPGAARQHLMSSLRVVERQNVNLRWEVECIRATLAPTGARLVLLKGAAYALAGLPVASGRSFGDIDIIVPKARLGAVESALMLDGWQSLNPDPYDQRYYRRWMHEIPPMTHVRRGTTIDVHHAILPETARVKVDTPALFGGAVAVPGQPGLYVLQPVDMLLHSATHLFHEGEFENGLRDLFDLDGLLRHFGATHGFWDALVPRARRLGLMRPLYYALCMTSSLLATPVPPHVTSAARAGRPAAPIAALMQACYRLALRPQHASVTSARSRLAVFALYVRSHWIRMPLHLLTYHLGRKLFVRPPQPSLDAAPAGATGAGAEPRA